MMEQVLGVKKLSDPSSALALVEEFEWQGRKWDMGYVDVWNGAPKQQQLRRRMNQNKEWSGVEWSGL
jgi:hypothetical protein